MTFWVALSTSSGKLSKSSSSSGSEFESSPGWSSRSGSFLFVAMLWAMAATTIKLQVVASFVRKPVRRAKKWYYQVKWQCKILLLNVVAICWSIALTLRFGILRYREFLIFTHVTVIVWQILSAVQTKLPYHGFGVVIFNWPQFFEL